ncbi:MAG: TetR/AcrR family transcriptional regulator [Mycobacterium sp.]
MGNREALLEAAIVCLRKYGYGGIRARELAATAGVSLGAIRYHFGSMELLLNTAIGETSRRWMDHFQSSLAVAADADNKSSPMRALYTVFHENQDLLAGYAEVFAHAQRSTAAREQLTEYYYEYRRQIARSLEAQGNKDAESVASILIALVDGLMVQWMLKPDLCPDVKVLEHVVARIVS